MKKKKKENAAEDREKFSEWDVEAVCLRGQQSATVYASLYVQKLIFLITSRARRRLPKSN